MLQVGEWLARWMGRFRSAERAGRGRIVHRHAIRRSALGRLTIRFDGGPCYAEMVDALESAYERFGCLVENREELSGREWIERIIATGQPVSAAELDAIRTLMHD